MAQKISVNGKFTTLPGVYVTFKSGVKNPSISQPYGNVVIIDDGIGGGFGGGSGVAGVNASGKDAIYDFNTIQDYQAFVKGGKLWHLGEALFQPSKDLTVPGVSKLTLIRACSTTPGIITFAFSHGTISFKTGDEGLNVNGALTGSNLTTGYAAKLIVSPTDPTMYVVQIYAATYKGIDPLNNTPFDNIAAADAVPQLIIESDPFTTVAGLQTWMLGSYQFLQGFNTVTVTGITSGGTIVAGDLTTFPGYNLATGGTETYNSTNFDLALTAIQNCDNTYFLCVNSDNQSLDNFKIQNFITNVSKYIKFMFLAGGNDSTDFVSNSIDTAVFYNTERALVVHGRFKRSIKTGKRIYATLYKTAMALGRACGLAPQDPLTFKDLWIDEEVHKLSDPELEQANAAGVMVTYQDIELGYDVVELDINTLQNNDFVINDDGTSYQHSIGRIKAELGRDIIYSAKKKFFGKKIGPNRATVSPEDVSAWLQGELQDNCPSAKQPDSLILSFQNIVVSVDGDTISISFEFQPNFEVNKMVFTAIIVDGTNS